MNIIEEYKKTINNGDIKILSSLLQTNPLSEEDLDFCIKYSQECFEFNIEHLLNNEKKQKYYEFTFPIKKDTEVDVMNNIIHNIFSTFISNFEQNPNLKVSDFYIENNIPIMMQEQIYKKICTLDDLILNVKENNLKNVSYIIDTYTINNHIANEIMLLATNHSSEKLIEKFLELGCDPSHDNHSLLLKLSEKGYKKPLSLSLLILHNMAHIEIKQEQDAYLDGDGNVQFKDSEYKSTIFKLTDETKIDFLFKNELFYKNLIKNKMISELKHCLDLQQKYEPFLENEINWTNLLQFAAQNNRFDSFILLIKAGKDDFFNNNDLYKQDINSIQKIATMFKKHDNAKQALLHETHYESATNLRYLLHNVKPLNLSKEDVYDALCVALEDSTPHIINIFLEYGYDNKDNVLNNYYKIKLENFINPPSIDPINTIKVTRGNYEEIEPNKHIQRIII